MKSPSSILVIEDDPWFGEQHIRALKTAGYETRYAADGVAAIRMLDEALPDLVVLDIFLPGPNALALLHEMQSYTDLARLPVVICTSSAADLPLKNLASYGVVEVLSKDTMRPDDIVRAVKRALA